MSLVRSTVRYGVALVVLAGVHYLATMGSLMLALATRGHIDSQPGPGATAASGFFFHCFQVLSWPLAAKWTTGGSTGGVATAWMLANGAIWSIVAIAAFVVVRRYVSRSQES